LWIDSQCVLSWIRSKKLLSSFVENRVNEIRSHEDISFHYIPSKDNPADIASRGVSVDDLLDNQLWWLGPKWLIQSCDNWPIWNCSLIEETEKQVIQSEYKKLPEQCESNLFAGEDALQAMKEYKVEPNAPFGLDIERFSTLTRLLRVTALVRRFIDKLRKRKYPDDEQINANDLEQAEKQWRAYTQKMHYSSLLDAIIKGKPNNLKVQLGIFVDENGLLRCQGRLERSQMHDGTKHPLLLPKGDYYTQLIIEHVHRSCLHAGLAQKLAQIRQKYWVPQGRSAVKMILKKCIVCKRWEGGPYQMPPMPPLPRKRVTQATPFSYTGVDYFGPLYTKSNAGPQKVWVCLFTCLVTRAIHLELLEDMTTERFLTGLRRCIACRGSPYEMISDNAGRYKLASGTTDKLWTQILTEPDAMSFASSKNIKWKFTIELAPWMGGFFES
ncbi:MAG: hypothetical protein N0E40_15975, partial [Candidatus Thiodiazotropha taylori]|nr:hypothetical protein [Candidatus Thiodiazotropha taylori]MCW4305465.1 hypothetical protein [Candidatus Thiodiazotropha taylori]